MDSQMSSKAGIRIRIRSDPGVLVGFGFQNTFGSELELLSDPEPIFKILLDPI